MKSLFFLIKEKPYKILMDGQEDYFNEIHRALISSSIVLEEKIRSLNMFHIFISSLFIDSSNSFLFIY